MSHEHHATIAATTATTTSVPALTELLATVPDRRQDQGKRHPLAALLAAAVAGILAGCRSQAAIAHWLRKHWDMAEPLGFTDRRPPAHNTFHYVFKALDIDAFEAIVSRWLALVSGEIGEGDVVRLDGKVLRGSRRGALPGLTLVSAYSDRMQSAIAQIKVAQGTNEHKAALELLRIIPLGGVVVSGDAAYTQRDVCHAIRGGGGDYYLRVKENQPALHAAIVDAFDEDLSPLGAQAS